LETTGIEGSCCVPEFRTNLISSVGGHQAERFCNARSGAGVGSPRHRLDNLEPAYLQEFDELYARPKADLHLYNKVMLDPIEVAFRKDWDRRPGGVPVSAEEKQNIRDGLARVLRDAFSRELTHSGRYQVVNVPGRSASCSRMGPGSARATRHSSPRAKLTANPVVGQLDTRFSQHENLNAIGSDVNACRDHKGRKERAQCARTRGESCGKSRTNKPAD
jgi:hypothetical protein